MSVSNYMNFALQMIILGGCLECIVIILGYIISSVMNLMKAR